jgi:hypothetical protein
MMSLMMANHAMTVGEMIPHIRSPSSSNVDQASLNGGSLHPRDSSDESKDQVFAFVHAASSSTGFPGPHIGRRATE